MTTTRRNLGLIAASSIALVLGGTAAVAAQAPGGEPLPDLGPIPSIDGGQTDELLQRPGNRRGQAFRGGRGFRGQRGDAARRGLSILGLDRRVVRNETILDAGDDGFVTQRIENGTVSAAGDGSLTIDLANGESSQVAITDDTRVITFDTEAATDRAFGPRRGLRGLRARMVESSIDDVAVGDSVNVASRSTDGGAFEAQRVVVRPDTDAVDASEAGGASDDDAALQLPAGAAVPAAA